MKQQSSPRQLLSEATRRQFIKLVGAGTVAGLATKYASAESLLTNASEAVKTFSFDSSWIQPPIRLEKPIQRSTIPITYPQRIGTYYQDVVPGTLDVAEQAQLGLNYFFGLLRDDWDYEMYFGGNLKYFYPHMTALGANQATALRAICFERVMTGSTENLDREAAMVDRMSSMLGGDGLYWVEADIEIKPWMVIPEPWVMVHGQGGMLHAMAALYEYTQDPHWKQRMDKMVDGLNKMVVHKGDYAYFPLHGFYDKGYAPSCMTPKGWKDTSEPATEKGGEEGSLFNHQGNVPDAIAICYSLTRNAKALKLTGELVRFLMQPKFWKDVADPNNDMVSYEYGHWTGHFHGHVDALRSILSYSILTNDQQLKDFVRDAYEWTRHYAFARIGYVGDGQACGIGRIIGLAVKLSLAGIGDYWDDVDGYIRNLGSQQQFRPEDIDFMKEVATHQTAPPLSQSGITYDRVIDRLTGGFAGRATKVIHWLCCGAHGNQGLFYAWDGAVQYRAGTANINLLINRASPWLDVYSYIPFEGKVIIKNKGANDIFIRMPAWVEKTSVVCHVEGRRLNPDWCGRYLHVQDVKAAHKVMVQFPVVDWSGKYLIPLVGGTDDDWSVPGAQKLSQTPPRQMHTCRFLGNTLINIMPPILPGSPTFQTGHRYLSSRTPMKTVRRYVSERSFTW